MAKSFQAQIDAWIAKSEHLMMAVAQDATQEVVKDMMTPRAKSGRFPVDTAYMRNSVTAQAGSMPRGPGNPSEGAATGGEQQIAAALLQWKPGQPMYVGILAEYAVYMEARYAFLALAVQKWPQRVNASVRKLRQRAGR